MIKEHVIIKGRNTKANERVAKTYTTNRNGRPIRDERLKSEQKFMYVEFYAKDGNHNLIIINDKEAEKFIKNNGIKVIDYTLNDIEFRKFILERSKKVNQISYLISDKFKSNIVTCQFIDEIEYVISEVICEEKYSLIGDDVLGEDMHIENGSQISVCRNKNKTKILWKDIWEYIQENSSYVRIYTYFDDDKVNINSLDTSSIMQTIIKTKMSVREAIVRLLILFC